jgi:hypothetical protein
MRCASFSDGLLNGMLVTSDWHRDEGDTRWSDHRRDITVYRYGANGGDAAYRCLNTERNACRVCVV